MKFAVGSALAALAILPALEAAPGRLDASKRSRVSTEDRLVLPDARPIERNEILMERRFEGEQLERKDALVGERRSPIAVEERREKTFFSTPERKEHELVERKDSQWSGKRARFSTGEDAYRSRVADRFQDKIGEASPLAGGMTPVVSKRTTFDRINRFAFRKNGEQDVAVVVAGSQGAARDLSGDAPPGAGGSGGAQPIPDSGGATLTPFRP